MKINELKQKNKKLFSEIEPGTLFKSGDSYFIKLADYVFRKRQSIANVKISTSDAFPDIEFNYWDDSVEAICVENGKAWPFRQSELIEVFPKAVICLDEEKTNA